MAWKLVNPNITNDPSYLEPRLNDDESNISTNTMSLAQSASDSLWKGLNVKVPLGTSLTPAKGDGVTDDTAALQALLNAAQNGAIYFPNGTYLISSALVVPSPIRIQFATDMTTIKFVGTGDAVQIFNQKHVYWNQGQIDISGADPNAIGLHIGGLWYGTFNSLRTVKNGLNQVGLLIDSSKPSGTHWGAYIIRIQDYTSTGEGFADIQTRQATGDTSGAITHLTIDGGWTTGGSYGIYLDHAYSTVIRQITCEGAVTNPQSGIYVGPNTTFTSIMDLGEIDSYTHQITVDGADQVYVYGDNTNGSNQDVNIINGGLCHRIGQFMHRINGKPGYYTEIHSDYSYAKAFRINVQGGGNTGGDLIWWGDNAGLHLWGGTGHSILIDSPMDFQQHTVNNLVWQSGVTSARPSNPVVGQVFYDTTLSKPIWCKVGGATPTWTDATGTTV